MFYKQNRQMLLHYHELFEEVLVVFCQQHFLNESYDVSALLFLPLHVLPPLAKHVFLFVHS